MKSYLRNLLFIGLIISNLDCLSQDVPNQLIIEDIRFASEQIRKYHANPYKFISKEKYDFLIDSLQKNVPTELPLKYVYTYLLPLVRELKCGHTSLFPDERSTGLSTIYTSEKEDEQNPHYFPYDLALIEDKVCVVRDFSLEAHFFQNSIEFNKPKGFLEKGTEIKSINGIDINKILERLKLYNYRFADGENEAVINNYLIRNFKYLFFICFREIPTFKLQIRKPFDDKYQTISVKAQTIFQIKKIENERYPIDFKRDFSNLTVSVIDQNTAHVRINAFERDLNENEVSFEEETLLIFKKLKEINTKNLILDIRGNSGGNLDYAENLLRYILPKSFKKVHLSIREATFDEKKKKDKLPFLPTKDAYFEEISKNTKLVEPDSLHLFTKNIFVLTNESTFSAASFLVVKMREFNIGTIIGSTCNGDFEGTSAGKFRRFILPHSKLELNIPLTKISYNSSRKLSLKPDFMVERNIKDFAENKDTILNFTLDLIKNNAKH